MFKKKKEYVINIYKAPKEQQPSLYTRYNWDAFLEGKLIGSGYNFTVSATQGEAELACREYTKLGKYTYKA